MIRLLAATAVAALLSFSASANTLNIITIPDPDVVPQSQSAPCIICATNQAHNPVGFGFNNFDSQGNDSSFNLFSSNITGAFANGDDLTVTPYTSGQLRNFLSALGDLGLGFSVAIDINTTGAKSEFLTQFRLLDLDASGSGPLGSLVLFDVLPQALPGIHNGNGEADYLITGFNLSGVDPTHRLLFQASWDHAVDGGESFYIVPNVQAVPIPAVGAGLPGMLAFLWLLNKRRRVRQLA